MTDAAHSFDVFFSVIRRLRGPDGCPWDREQTPLSLRGGLIEEVFEAVEAISEGDAAHAREELGDVMLNASMIAYMYEQRGDFTLSQVLQDVADKLVRRHPHVFDESSGASQMTGAAKTAPQVLSQWEAIKRNVEGRASDSVLDEVPPGFPPLMRAHKLQKKAAKKGFDWKRVQDVAAKVDEELAEVRAAAAVLDDAARISGGSASAARPFSEGSPVELDSAQLRLEEEAGDLLFAVVNLARHLGVDPSVALSRANAKFCRRFRAVEQGMAEAGIPMDGDHLAQMDRLWDEAKANGL